jgi:hypothetical protein
MGRLRGVPEAQAGGDRQANPLQSHGPNSSRCQSHAVAGGANAQRARPDSTFGKMPDAATRASMESCGVSGN